MEYREDAAHVFSHVGTAWPGWVRAASLPQSESESGIVTTPGPAFLTLKVSLPVQNWKCISNAAHFLIKEYSLSLVAEECDRQVKLTTQKMTILHSIFSSSTCQRMCVVCQVIARARVIFSPFAIWSVRWRHGRRCARVRARANVTVLWFFWRTACLCLRNLHVTCRGGRDVAMFPMMECGEEEEYWVLEKAWMRNSGLSGRTGRSGMRRSADTRQLFV